MAFTYDILNKSKKGPLQKLCKYYEIEWDNKMSKSDLIDAILEYFWVDEEIVEDDVPRSARIKRLRRLNNG